MKTINVERRLETRRLVNVYGRKLRWRLGAKRLLRVTPTLTAPARVKKPSWVKFRGAEVEELVLSLHASNEAKKSEKKA